MFATIYQVSEKDGMPVVRVPQLDVPDTRVLEDLGLSVGGPVAQPHASHLLQRVWRRISGAAAPHLTEVASVQ